MFERLRNFFRRENPVTVSAPVHERVANGNERRPVQQYIYPPVANGIPRFPVSEILEEHAKIIDSLRNLSENEDVFEERYMPVINRYANLVYLLPASESHHHRGAGGLLSHGLESAQYALQQAYNRLHGMNLSPLKRKLARERWLFAVFIAGLCHDQGKTAEMLVISAAGEVWDPYSTPLAQWFHGLPPADERLFVTWRRENQDHRYIAMNQMNHVVLPGDLTYLHEVEPFLLTQIHQAIIGKKTPGNDLVEMVREADNRSLKSDLQKSNVLTDLGPEIHQPLARHFVMTIKRLIKEARDSEEKVAAIMQEAEKGDRTIEEICKAHNTDNMTYSQWRHWRPNEPGSVLWVIGSGVYLIWPECIEDITNLLHRDGTPGIPSDPYLVANILEDYGLLLVSGWGEPVIGSRGQQPNRLWRLWPSLLYPRSRGKEAGLLALRLKDPRYVLDLVPPAVTGEVLPEGQEEPGEPADISPHISGGEGEPLVESSSTSEPPEDLAPASPGISFADYISVPDLLTLTEVQEHFAKAGLGGQALLKLASEIIQHVRCEGQDYKTSPRLLLSWGDKKFTDESNLPEVIESLARANCLVLDGSRRRVHDEPGFGRCLKLREGETKLFLRLVWALEHATSSEPEAQSEPPSADAPSPEIGVMSPEKTPSSSDQEKPDSIWKPGGTGHHPASEADPEWVIEVMTLLDSSGPLEYVWVKEMVTNRTGRKQAIYQLVDKYFIIEDFEDGKKVTRRRS